MQVTTTQLKKILTLRADGFSIRRISEEVQINKETVTNKIREYRELVTGLHSVQLDTLVRDEKVNAEERIKSLSLIHTRIREELEGRDLSTVPTEKLVDMYLKTSEAIKKETDPITIYSSEEADKLRQSRELEESMNWSNTNTPDDKTLYLEN